MAPKTKEDILEETIETIEDTLDILEAKPSWIPSNPKTLIGIASLTGLAIGAALGYRIASKRLESKYQQLADAQVEDVKAHYAILRKDGEKGDLATLAAPYTSDEAEEAAEVRATSAAIAIQEGYTPYDKVRPVVEVPKSAVTQLVAPEAEAEVEERNVFESNMPDTYFIMEEELQHRIEYPEEPFVLTKDEFDANETDADQNTLTYYEGDDVLADEQDHPINEKDAVIGVKNLLRFGHGSGDPKVVYIRNTKLDIDFEVVQSDGKFAKEVLGFDDGERAELKHADRRPIRRFRPTDE